MYYIYRISSSYDGFTPDKISKRLNKKYFDYNWAQYFDQVKRGDIVFTYFIGRGVKRGIYLISKVVERKTPNIARAKVLSYDLKEPIFSDDDLANYRKVIFNRPRGSVFVIPTFLDSFFEEILRETVISDIQISENIDCLDCFEKNDFPCDTCSIFDADYIINYRKEVVLKIPGYDAVTAPFWVIPYQSHWTKTTVSNHTISRIFYSFKSGFNQYSRLFARGIKKAIKSDPQIKKVKFDLILGVPLSPRKKKNKEFDRVNELCLELSKVLKVKYRSNGLSLSKHISRREYRYSYGTRKFMKDYKKRLNVNIRSLNKKQILIIDDVITDGKTLQAISQKIKEQFPNSKLYGAAGAIMAKKRNASRSAIRKFKK